MYVQDVHPECDSDLEYIFPHQIHVFNNVTLIRHIVESCLSISESMFAQKGSYGICPQRRKAERCKSAEHVWLQNMYGQYVHQERDSDLEYIFPHQIHLFNNVALIRLIVESSLSISEFIFAQKGSYGIGPQRCKAMRCKPKSCSARTWKS